MIVRHGCTGQRESDGVHRTRTVANLAFHTIMHPQVGPVAFADSSSGASLGVI